jgi:hypothetical protein
MEKEMQRFGVAFYRAIAEAAVKTLNERFDIQMKYEPSRGPFTTEEIESIVACGTLLREKPQQATD